MNASFDVGLGVWPTEAGFLQALRHSWVAQYADYLGREAADNLVQRLHESGELYRHDEQYLAIARAGEHCVGLASLRPMGPASLVTSLEVLASCRGQGVGRALIATLGEHTERMFAHVSIHRPQARRFYENLGFHVLQRTVVDHYGHALEFDVLAR